MEHCLERQYCHNVPNTEIYKERTQQASLWQRKMTAAMWKGHLRP